MPDDVLANQSQTGDSAGQAVAKPPASPWEEILESDETPNRRGPTIIGSLDGAVVAPPQNQVAPLSLPQDIEEKVGQKVPAENLVEAQPAGDQAGGLPHPPRELEIAGQSGSGLNPSEGKVVSFATDIKKPSALPPKTPPVSPSLPPASSSPVSSPAVPPPSVPVQPIASPPRVPAVPAAPPPTTAPEKRLGLVGTLRNRMRPSAAPAPNPPPTTVDDYVKAQIDQKPLSVQAKAPLNQTGRPFWHSAPILMAGGFIGLIAIIIFLTELGFFSLGLEKAYGAVGLERLWGGLPKNITSAILLSASEMGAEPNFKVQGEINLTVDKSKKSPITSPLVALDQTGGNVLVRSANIIAASSRLAADYDYSDFLESDYSEDDYYLDEESDAETEIEEEEIESTPSASNQEQYPSYQPSGTAAKEINSTLSANFGREGSEAAIKVKRVTGDDEILLRTMNDKLWVKSPSRLKFNEEATPNDWSEYTLVSLQNKLLQHDFFTLSDDDGFSVVGRRVANERLGEERAYRYSLESLEIGGALDDLGLDSDMIQSVSGDIWIGIRDKRIKRVNLAIITSPAAAVTQIVANLDFSDYGGVNSILKPDAGAIVIPGVKATPTGTAAGAAPPPVVTGDVKRKSDLASIKSALADYKQAKGSYPVAATLLKLNAGGNALEVKLVPTYLAALPRDSKEAEGWFYGYKSDGRTYSLSARLEDVSDPEGQSAGGVYLYYLKDE
ncbi:MAG: hypothetical protein AAB360_00430 [Patescibacteria group bacterium]